MAHHLLLFSELADCNTEFEEKLLTKRPRQPLCLRFQIRSFTRKAYPNLPLLTARGKRNSPSVSPTAEDLTDEYLANLIPGDTACA